MCLAHAPSKLAKAELYGLRVVAATVATDWPRALRWGREGLSVFGQQWPLEGLADAIGAEVAAVMKNVGKRKSETLVDAPDVEDADIRASMHLLSLLGAPAYFSGAEVLTFLVSRAVNLSLVHGPSPCSAFAYVLYGGIHNAVTGQYDIGYAFGKLALAMAKRFGNRAEECRTVEVYGVLVHHWKAPLRDSLPLLKEGFRAGVESGELAFAASTPCSSTAREVSVIERQARHIERLVDDLLDVSRITTGRSHRPITAHLVVRGYAPQVPERDADCCESRGRRTWVPVSRTRLGAVARPG